MARKKKPRLAGHELLIALDQACDGLIYSSETDSEINVITDHAAESIEDFLEKLHMNEPDEAKPADEFFNRLTSDRDWHSENEKKRVRRFRTLKKLMIENLTDLRLIRIGRIRIDIFVLGYDADRNIAGIRTKAVET